MGIPFNPNQRVSGLVELVPKSHHRRGKMKKTLLGLLIVVLLTAACAPLSAAYEEQSITQAAQAEVPDGTTASTAGFSVTDALGREVIFESYPEKIVLAGKLRTMIADFLYLFESSAQKILAIETGGQTPDNFIALLDEDIENKYSLEKGAGAEQIAPLQPDLVILKTSMKESIGDALETIGIAVVYVDFETVEQIYRDIRILGQVLNENERAELIVQKYQDLYTEFSGYVQTGQAKNTVLLMQVSDAENQYAYEVPSVSYLQTYMVEAAGGEAVWKEAAQAGGWNEVNLEQVNAWNPQRIFVINYQAKAVEIVSALTDSPPFSSLDAVKNGQVKAFPLDYLSWDQPDPRWILGYSWLVYQINPGTVERDYMLAKVTEFYQFFYGLEDQVIQENILPRIEQYY